MRKINSYTNMQSLEILERMKKKGGGSYHLNNKKQISQSRSSIKDSRFKDGQH